MQSLQQSKEVVIIVSILQIRKLRHRDIEFIAQVPIASKIARRVGIHTTYLQSVYADLLC